MSDEIGLSNTITRQQFEKLSGREATEFFDNGGQVFSPPDPKDAEKANAELVSPYTGQTLKRGEWDKMTTKERCAWLYGEENK